MLGIRCIICFIHVLTLVYSTISDPILELEGDFERALINPCGEEDIHVCVDCSGYALCNNGTVGGIAPPCDSNMVCKEENNDATCVPPASFPPCNCEGKEDLSEHPDPYDDNKYIVCYRGNYAVEYCEPDDIFYEGVGCGIRTTTPATTITTSPPCPPSGVTQTAINCTHFHLCFSGTYYLESCNEDQIFDNVTESCESYPVFECPGGLVGATEDTYDCSAYYVCPDGYRQYCYEGQFDPATNVCINGTNCTSSETLYECYNLIAPTESPPTSNPPTGPTSNPPTGPTSNPPTGPTSNPPTGPTSNPPTGPTSNPPTGPTSNPPTGPTSNPPTGPTSNPPTGPTSNPPTGPTSNPPTGPTSNLPTGPTSNPPTGPTSNPSTAPTSNPSTAPTSNPSTGPTNVTSSPPNPSVCTFDGERFPIEDNMCSNNFYECSFNGNQYEIITRSCPEGFYFDPSTQYCATQCP